MSVSLHVKLRELHRCGAIELRYDPKRHYFGPVYDKQGKLIDAGEGSYFYKGEPLQIATNVWNPGTQPQVLQDILKRDEIVFNEMTDLAWCPIQQILVSYATSTTEEFSLPDSVQERSEDESVPVKLGPKQADNRAVV